MLQLSKIVFALALLMYVNADTWIDCPKDESIFYGYRDELVQKTVDHFWMPNAETSITWIFSTTFYADCRKDIKYYNNKCEWKLFKDNGKNLNLKCDNNEVITGLHFHENDLKIKCCKIDDEKIVLSCSEIVNDWKMINHFSKEFRLKPTQFLSGLRRVVLYDDMKDEPYDSWHFKVCRATKCNIVGMDIMSGKTSVTKTSKVLGMAVSLNCNPNVYMRVQQEESESVEETFEVIDTQSQTYNVYKTVSIGFEKETTFYNLDFEISGTRGLSWGSKSGNGFGTSRTVNLHSSHQTEYLGSAGAITITAVDEYNSNINEALARYKVKCSDGKTHFENSTVDVHSTTFGRSDYITRVARFPDVNSCLEHQVEIEGCFKRIRNFARTSTEAMIDKFKECFKINGTYVYTKFSL